MKKVLFTFLLCSFSVLLGFAENDQPLSPLTTNDNLPSLGTILNEDGSINTSTGISGSFNPQGFQLISKPGEAPRFAPVNLPSMKLAGDEFWSDPFSISSFGPTSVIRAVLVSGGTIYLGGQFQDVNNIADADNIVRWMGTQWMEMGTGMDNMVGALATDGTYIYAGGMFITAGGVTANHIARWSIAGQTWSAMGTGTNSNVWSIARSGANIYAGGAFTNAGGVSANYIARWNGTTWSALGTGLSSIPWALAISGTNLYAAGDFITAGGVTVNRIALWNGTTWSALGTGLNASASALSIYGSKIYVGGNFTTAGGVTVNRIAMWNGTTWAALGAGADNWVLSIKATSTSVYIGGEFLNVGGVSANHIAVWNGSSWSQVSSSGLNDWVYALDTLGTDVYAGGEFANAGGDPNADFISKWGGGFWQSFPTGITDYIYSVAVKGQDIYIGGNFTNAGGIANADYIAKWNGSNWSALGPGLNSFVMAVEIAGTDVYVGGSFSNAGGNAFADYIARWDGSSWYPLGTGLGSWVHAIEADGNNIYVGGEFLLAGGVTNANYIAKWSGGAWSALGTGLNATVNVLKYDNGILYAGGQFTNAGGNANADYLAQWNGSNWLAIGTTPLSSDVWAIDISGNNIYVGGGFLNAGGIAAADYVAKWNGSAWEALGTSVNAGVLSLMLLNNDLYVCGNFTSAGGNPNCKYIARWDGSSWNNLGSSTNAAVRAISSDSSYLYVGGSFTIVGGKTIRNFARYGVLPKITTNPLPLTKCEGGSATFHIHTNGSVQKIFQWKFNGIDIPTATDSTITISPLSLGDQGYYSCRVNNPCGSITSDSALLTVNPKPIPIIGSDTSFCTGDSVYITTSLSYSNYLWSTTSAASGIFVTAPGNYYVSVTDGLGCSGLSNTINVIEHPLPNVSVTSGLNPICLNSSTQFTASGANTYDWSPSTGLSSTTGSIVTANPITTSAYIVTGTDLNGCSNTASITINVLVPFEGEQICIVTVDTSINKNKIIWEKTPNVKTDHYKVLKESTFAGVYDVIGIVPYDSMSVFTDTSSHPDQVLARYRIVVVDSCGNESDSSITHQTLHLQVSTGVPSGHQLQWNAYVGNFSFGTYYIYAGNTPNTLVKIDSLANTIFDRTYPSPPVGQKYYAVVVKKGDTCTATSAAKDQTETYNTSVSNMEEYQILGVGENQDNLFSLNAYPNPFNNSINITYILLEKVQIRIEIYNILGEKAADVLNTTQIPGNYKIEFSTEKNKLSNGIYYIRALFNNNIVIKKVIKL